MSKQINTNKAQLPADEFKKSMQEKILEATPDNKLREAEEQIRIEVTHDLIKDLVSFVTTGEGTTSLKQSLKNDRSLYTRIAQIIYEANEAKKINPPWPLQFAIKNPFLFPDVIEYLLENGAGYAHNQSGETKQLFFMVSLSESRIDIFKQLINAGYFANEDNIDSLYHIPSISFRKTYDKIIFKNDTEKLLAVNSKMLYDAACEANLRVVQYFYQQNIRLEPGIPLPKVAPIAQNNCLDTLKYLLINDEETPKKINFSYALYGASREDSLPIVHYLVNNYKYTEQELSTAEECSTAEKKYAEAAKSNVKKYLHYYNLKMKYLYLFNIKAPLQLEKAHKLIELERSELQKISEKGMAYLAFASNAKDLKKRRILNQLLHLALTAGEEVKWMDTKNCIMPRLTAINHLLPINPFAAQYAWQQLINSGDHKEIDSVLVTLAKHYKYYTKTTGHITDLAVHENFSNAFSDEFPNSSSTTLPALRAIEARRILVPLFPVVLVSLMMEYAAPQSPFTTPDLIHIWEALNSDLTSKEEAHCQHCRALLSEPTYFSTFSDKNKKVETTLSSTKERGHPFTKG